MLDKILHFGISGAISFVLYIISFELFPQMNTLTRGCLAAGIGLMPGILKEIADTKFDVGDLIADIGGVIVGVIIGEGG